MIKEDRKEVAEERRENSRLRTDDRDAYLNTLEVFIKNNPR